MLSYTPRPDKTKLTNKVSDYLSANGFCEAMCNSLSQSDYYKDILLILEIALVALLFIEWALHVADGV